MDMLANLCGDSGCRKLNQRTRTCLLVLLVLLFTSCNSEDGETQLATIQGASMFPILPGNHFRLKCPECHFHFQIDADNIPKSKDAVCPNCGYSHVPIIFSDKKTPELLNLRPIDRPIERWDVVAFRIPEGLKSGGGIGVKRVVGLPGETLSIVGGEIVLDGRLARRNVDVQQQMQVRVHDSQFAPLDSAPRWLVEDGWSFVDDAFGYDSSKVHGKKKWLTYQHKRCYTDAMGRESDAHIEDNYGCNQNVARSLNKIRDVVVAAELTATSGAQLIFQFESGDDVTEAMVDFSRSQVVVSNGNDKKTIPVDESDLAGRYRIVVSNIDSQATVEINNVPIVRTNWLRSKPREKHPALNIRIGAAREDVQISRIAIWRDNYYFVESGREATWTLGDNEYLLLGDNCPVSVDSRRFGPISRENIVGRLDLNRIR